MELKKYSYKCINFLNEHNLFFDVDIEQNSFLRNVEDAIKETSNIDIKYIIHSTGKINKIHDKDEYPTIYKYYTDHYEKNISFEEFTLLFREDPEKILSNDDDFISYSNKYFPDRKIINELIYDNMFIGLDIIQFCEIHDFDYNIYKFPDGTIIKIFDPDVINLKRIDIDIIYKLIALVRKIAMNNRPVEINIINTTQRKEFTFPTILGTDNINSGFTEFGSDDRIVIYRNEEIYKIIVHELLHYYHIGISNDFRHLDNVNVECIKCDNYVNEAVVEFHAVLIYMKFIEHVTKINYKRLIDIEYSFSILQIAKILIFFNMNDSRCILKKNKCGSIKQRTSFFSYFIIKTLFLHNFKKSFEVMNNINKLNDNGDVIMRYVTNILERSDDFYKKINTVIQFLTEMNYEPLNEKNNFVLRTTRMSCIEL